MQRCMFDGLLHYCGIAAVFCACSSTLRPLQRGIANEMSFDLSDDEWMVPVGCEEEDCEPMPFEEPPDESEFASPPPNVFEFASPPPHAKTSSPHNEPTAACAPASVASCSSSSSLVLPEIVTPDRSKRRRLRQKSPGVMLTPEKPLQTEDVELLVMKYSHLPVADQRAIMNKFRQKKFRLLTKLKKVGVITLGDQVWNQPPPGEETAQFLENFSQAFLKSEAELMTNSLVDRGFCYASLAKSPENELDESRKELEQRGLKQKSILMTYQGEWGIVDLPIDKSVSIEGITTQLQQSSTVADLKIEAVQMLENLRATRKIKNFACSLELCTKTWTEKGVVRIHLHVWIVKGQGHLAVLGLLFRGSMPFLNSEAVQFCGGANGRGSRSQVASLAGHFYVTVEKIGMVWSTSTIKSHEHYCVKDYWVTTLLTTGKISREVARKNYLMCITRAEFNVKQMDYVHKQQLDMELERDRIENLRAIMATQTRFKVIPDVVEWSRQYDQLRSRYKFLILDGKSGTGKTRFCYNLAGEPTAVCYCDCSSGMPDLRHFCRKQHSVLLLDEIGADSVIQIKKVMQAGIDVCSLGSSPTQQHVYRVCTFQTKIVVATNIWKRTVVNLPREDQDWLEANSYYVFVNGPLWEEESPV